MPRPNRGRVKLTLNLSPETIRGLKEKALAQETYPGDIVEKLYRESLKGQTEMTTTAATSYRTEDIDPDHLTALDLREEVERVEEEYQSALASDPDQSAQVKEYPQAACVTLLDENEKEFPERAEVLFFPFARRAGIAWGGNAVWTDANSIEDALNRYLNDEMIP